MSTKNALIVTLTGIAVGAALGILFAPDKGTELRKKIGKKGEGLLDSLKGKFDEFIDEVKDQLETTKEDAEELMGKVKSRAHEVKNDAKAAIN